MRCLRTTARQEVAEWEALFPNGVFVHLVIYADESGTHDRTGEDRGAREAVLGGIAGLRDNWLSFRNGWGAVLEKYNATYFHYRKWRAADRVIRLKEDAASDFNENPYRSWSAEDLRAFIIELATVAGSGDYIPVGSHVFTQRFYRAKIKGDVALTSDPYERMANDFFSSTIDIIGKLRPPWKRLPVNFIFDGPPKDPRWRHTISDAFEAHKRQNPRSTFSWGCTDKTDPENFPLQAADLVAYRGRIAAGSWLDLNPDAFWLEVDGHIFKSVFDWMTAHKEIMLPYILSGGLFDYDEYKDR